MKNILAAALIVLTLSGCAGSRHLPIAGNGAKVEVQTYGLLNADEVKQECVNYELSVGNMVWSVILLETIVAPIYFIGFSIYEPISVDYECLAKKSVASS